MIENRDSQKLFSILHPNIKFDFDEGIGIEKFKQKWLPQDRNSELWPILRTIVDLGGVFVKNESDPFYRFVFPYVNEVELDGDVYFNTLVITTNNAPLYEKPDEKSRVLAHLSYDVVGYDYEKSKPGEWSFVQVDKTISGYISV